MVWEVLRAGDAHAIPWASSLVVGCP